MVDPQSSTDETSRNESSTDQIILQSALDQFQEDCHLYNEAVGSYNTHLDNHRDRRDLHDIPFRVPISTNEEFEGAIDGDRPAIEALLAHLIDQAHLDSQLRRHPRTYPIHDEATEHLEDARGQLITTLEEALYHIHENADRTIS